MDEQLIKPQRARRVVRIRPGTPADVVAHNTLIEVSDPGTLRPHEFRADFVFNPTETVQDVAQEELTPLISNVLNGIDSTVVITGPDDGGQIELMDEQTGLGILAVDRLHSMLLQREAAQRQQGGSYRFSMKLQYFMLHGDRIHDLLPDKSEPAMLQDTVDGVAIVGVRSLTVTGTREVMEALDAANRRRISTGIPRGQTGLIFHLEVTQADYRALTGIFGRLMLVETPALDCLAQDRNLVQVHEGFDTFRGVFHLRSIAADWTPRHTADVKATALTWLLRDALTGGSTVLTILASLRQGQPLKSRVILEFLKELSKVETNPVPWDNRVAGLARALRADALQATSLQDAHRRADGRQREEEDMRRQIMELQRLLQEAQRGLVQSGTSDQVSKQRAVELAQAYKAEAEMNEELIVMTEHRNREYQTVIEEEQQKAAVQQEMNERKYQDADTMLHLFTEVEEFEVSMQEAQKVREELGAALEKGAGAEASLAQVGDWRTSEHAQVALLDQVRTELRTAQEEATAAVAQSTESTSGQQHLEQEVSRMQDQLRVAQEGERRAHAAHEAADEELAKLRHSLQASLGEAQVPSAGPEARSPSPTDLPPGASKDLLKKSLEREQALAQECRDLRQQVRKLQEEVVNTTHKALSWASDSVPAEEKLKVQQGLQVAEREAADAARADADRDKGLREREAALEREKQDLPTKLAAVRRDLETEFEKERERHRQERDRYLKDLEARDIELARKDSEIQVRSSQAAASVPQRSHAGSDLAKWQEEKKSLQEQLQLLQQQAPADQRKQLQRMKWLEKQVQELETERTNLMVRATVAEEMVQQHDQAVKQMAQGYERDLANMRRELAAARR
mmetsp:Transcript_1909/g.4883  ORF Transcript_1909/g.4883 Transcript_1909/m.4883 type:complete len:857 (-) Transcript_1909:70-2640(-)